MSEKKTIVLPDRIVQMAAAAAAKQPSEPENLAASSAKVYYLPPPSEKFIPVPNVILRSALFGANRKGRRAMRKDFKIECFSGIKMTYSGETLDQSDLDVWAQCIRLAASNAAEQEITFTSKSFLKAIGRSVGGSDKKWLHKVLVRLSNANLRIQEGDITYFGNLIYDGTTDEASAVHTIQLNPKLAKLFGPKAWSGVEWEQRLRLIGSPLAQWLHAFYTSHAKPHPIKPDTLRKLCGSQMSDLKHFMEPLKENLDKVIEATGWSWDWDEHGNVDMTKIPTPSQKRHLSRKASEAKQVAAAQRRA